MTPLKRATLNGGPDSPGYGWLLWCPGCNEVHVICTEPVPAQPGRAMWQFDGNVASPTFSPSLLCTWTEGEQHTPMVCHSFIRAGRIEFLSDCTHALAGQTVPMVDYETATAARAATDSTD